MKKVIVNTNNCILYKGGKLLEGESWNYNGKNLNSAKIYARAYDADAFIFEDRVNKERHYYVSLKVIDEDYIPRFGLFFETTKSVFDRYVETSSEARGLPVTDTEG